MSWSGSLLRSLAEFLLIFIFLLGRNFRLGFVGTSPCFANFCGYSGDLAGIWFYGGELIIRTYFRYIFT